MQENRDCGAPGAQPGAVPRTCVPFAHVPAVPVVTVPVVPVPVPAGLPVLSVAGVLPDRTGNVDVTRFLEEWAAVPLAGKADKAPPASVGNLASLDASGNLADSGATPASIKAAAVAEVVANAPGTMDTLKEIADILGSVQQSGTVLKWISDLESGKVDKEAGKGLVAVDATLTTQGAAADAKAVGDALRSGFTEWSLSGVPSGYTATMAGFSESSTWDLFVVGPDMLPDGETFFASGDGSETSLSFSTPVGTITATRHLITPTKTSQLTNDSGFLTSHQDISGKADKSVPSAAGNLASFDSSGNLADSGVKASDFAVPSDLPYSLVTPGEWTWSDGGNYEMPAPSLLNTGEYAYQIRFDGVTKYNSQFFGTEADALAALRLEFVYNPGEPVFNTATRASLPGHLLDRAVNAVPVTGTTTLTLPAAATGKSRGFYLKMTVTGSQIVSFSPSTGITYTGFGDPAKTYSAGTYLLRFTETSGNEFCVTDMLAEYADVSALPYALVSKTPVSGVVTLSDRAVNLVSPTVTALQPVWEWSDGLDHGQPKYGVINDYGDYQEYGWGFQGEGETLSEYDSFGNYYSLVYDSDDATELSFYGYDTDGAIVASLVTPYETDVSSLALPPAVTGKSRDFMVRLAMPEHATMFSWPSGVVFETEDGEFPDVSEPGVYLLAFTETGAGRFALMCRKVQGVE